MPKNQWPIESARVLEYESDLDRLGQAIELHMNQARERKWSRALQWFRNAAFLAGQHHDTFKYKQGGTFTQDTVVIPPRMQDVMSPHMVDNHVLRIAQANIAELTGMNPFPVVDPASLSPDDQDLAKIGELILNVLWEAPLRVPEKLRVLVAYLEICGTAAAETYFSELNSVEERMKLELREIPNLISGKTVQDWVESVDKTEWTYKQGLRLNIWSGFHLDVNPDATSDPDTLTWVCRTTFEDVELMKRMFDRDEKNYHPDALKGLGPSEYSDDALWHWEQLKDLVDSPTSDTPVTLERNSRRSLAGCTRVRMIDTRPNLEAPMGRTIVSVGGKVVYAGPSRSWSQAYPERWTPMRIARWWTLPGRFEGIPLISPLIPLQKRVNALDCLIRINRQHMGVGAWLLPKACKVPEGLIGPFNGQNITYNFGPRGEKPERVPFLPLTADIWEERAGCVSSMERLGGIASSQLSTATSPSALRAGVMLDFAQRQALQSKSAVLLDFEAFVGGLAQDILQEVARNMGDDPELLRRVSVAARELGDLAIERYTTLDLRDNVRVKIDLRSQMLQTPEAKKEAAATFLQFAGQGMSPVERAKVATIMGLDEIESQASAQWKRARRMVERVLQGDVSAAVALEGVDDPGLFGEVVRDAMLSERATTAPMEVKRALQSLMDAYSEQIRAKAATMASVIAEQAQNSSPVASPPPGGQNGG
jgi:hypothetical protein